MEDLVVKVVSVLLIGVVCAIIATNLINGIKESLGLTKITNELVRVLVIKALTFLIDGFVCYWVYFNVQGLTDVATFVIVCLCAIAGAETVYDIVGKLNELKATEKAVEIVEEVNTEEGIG